MSLLGQHSTGWHGKPVFREGLQEDQFADLMKNANRPENCYALQKTRVNQLIWNLLRAETRTDDAKFQNIQNSLVKAAVNMT